MYHTVCKTSDVPDPGKMLVEVDERLLVLFHVEGSFYCLDDVCTHDGGTLYDGTLDACAIACPRHGAQFDIRTGQPLTMPATEPTVCHEVRVVDDQVQVQPAAED